MYKRQIQQLAAPADLYERPENAFVAEFIGENNRLLGTIITTEGDKCGVEVAGQSISALNIQKEEIGTACSLSLRPERVMLNPEPGQCVNNFGAKIVELIYLGDHIRCRMNVCANDEFIVKVPNTQPNLTLKEGDDVKVGWHIEDCRALDA